MNQEELNKILEEHKRWITNPGEGKRADFRSANLNHADLGYADLRNTDLSYADLSYAYLRGADLRNTNLRYADLGYADLRNTNLRYADLSGADLSQADFSYADLRDADLDFSVFPLWCGSFDMIIDDKLISQLIYHIFRLQGESKFFKKIKKTKWLKDIANQFHRANQCGKVI